MQLSVGGDPGYGFELVHAALVVIDMQHDFCSVGGYGDSIGCDVSLTRAVIPAITGVLGAVRDGGMTVAHTQQGNAPDLSDLPANVLHQSQQAGARIGDRGPLGRHLIRGEPGYAFVNELQPREGEIVISKPGKSAFYATSLEDDLRARGITHLLFSGVTTDVCVHSTLRDAHDRGFWCLLLEDCCAAYNPAYHRACVDMVRTQSGIFGWVARSEELLAALAPAM